MRRVISEVRAAAAFLTTARVVLSLFPELASVLSEAERPTPKDTSAHLFLFLLLLLWVFPPHRHFGPLERFLPAFCLLVSEDGIHPGCLIAAVTALLRGQPRQPPYRCQ